MTFLARNASYLLLFSLASAFEGQEELKVKPGEDVTLQCQGPRDAAITRLEWSRPDLKDDGYVFFYRNSRPYENYQHPSFLGRVELRNKSSVKDGDVSVILKNVHINDTGTYECRIISSSTGSSGRTTTELKQLTNLKVSESGDTAENTWDGENKDVENKTERSGGDEIVIAIVLSVVAVVFVGVVLIYLVTRRKHDYKLRRYLDCHEKSDPTEV